MLQSSMCELSNIRQPLSHISNIFSIRSPIFCGNAISLPRTFPSIFIVPLVGYIKPLTARINIDFPEPFITMNYAGLKDDALTALIHLCIIESINNLDQQTQKAESTLPRIRLLYIHFYFLFCMKLSIIAITPSTPSFATFRHRS